MSVDPWDHLLYALLYLVTTVGWLLCEWIGLSILAAWWITRRWRP